MKHLTSFALLAAVSLLTACTTIVDGAREGIFGTEKRDILTSRVIAAKKAQEDTQKVFKNALDEFSSVVSYDGGDLEAEYRKMQAAYDRCDSRANDLADRIADVERVSRALFKEWDKENKEYENTIYRQNSERQLYATKRSCDDMIAAMRRAQSKVTPVLRVLRDQVLFLKHNLNATALASLKNEQARVESDIVALIDEMNRAINESQQFIDQLTN